MSPAMAAVLPSRAMAAQRALHRLDRRTLQIARDDHDMEAQLREPGDRQQRRLAALEHVDQLPSGQAPRDFGDLRFAGRRVEERDVGARFDIRVAAVDRRVETFDGDRVGAGNDDEVGIVQARRATAFSLPTISCTGTTDLSS